MIRTSAASTNMSPQETMEDPHRQVQRHGVTSSYGIPQQDKLENLRCQLPELQSLQSGVLTVDLNTPNSRRHGVTSSYGIPQKDKLENLRCQLAELQSLQSGVLTVDLNTPTEHGVTSSYGIQNNDEVENLHGQLAELQSLEGGLLNVDLKTPTSEHDDSVEILASSEKYLHPHTVLEVQQRHLYDASRRYHQRMTANTTRSVGWSSLSSLDNSNRSIGLFVDDEQEPKNNDDDELKQLRRHLADLQQQLSRRLENWIPASGGGNGRIDRSELPPPLKDFTIKEQSFSSSPDQRFEPGKEPSKLPYFVGAITLIGIVLAIIFLTKISSLDTVASPAPAPAPAPPAPIQPPGGGGPEAPVPPCSSSGNGDDDDSTIITLSELALHSTPEDCWVALHGIVYDLTDYAQSRHPAGASIITRLAGKDGTIEYTRFHSEPLLSSVQDDIVGALENTAAIKNPDDGDGCPPNNNNGGSNSSPPTSPSDPPTSLLPETSNGCSPANDINCVSIEELSNHDSADDCWVAMYGNVYDMTEYAEQIHPGGSFIITKLAGKDGTIEYSRFHPENLLESVQDTLIGPYEGGQPTEVPDQGGGGSDDESWESSDP